MKETSHIPFDQLSSTKNVLDSLQIGVVIHDPSAKVLFSNKAAQTLLGLNGAELCGEELINSEWRACREDGTDLSCHKFPFNIAIAEQRTVSNIIIGVYRPGTADKVWLQVNAEPLFDIDGNLKEVISSFSDITDRKAAEEKLTQLYQHLESRAFELATSTADLQRFVYVATHDLQEPLRLVTSFTQLLKKKYANALDEQATEYINYAVDGAQRLKKLILDLLEYSRFSSNQEEFTTTDVREVIRAVEEKFSAEIMASDAIMEIDELPVIKARTALLSQLFEQLISNALKYRNGKSPSIRITCDESDTSYRFSVADNGIGIDPRYSEKIFVLFQRLHANASNSTGIGLAICKKIVELHRGAIWVQSEPGQGSTFYFTIPKMLTEDHA